MVEILKEKCIGCGQCVKECFPNCLTVVDGKAHANHICIDCGHCYAVCPTKAICLPEQSEDGRFTPTGGNIQDVRYIFIQENLETLKKLVWDGLHSAIKEAEHTHTIQERYRFILQNLCDAYANNSSDDRLFFNAPALLIVLSNSAMNGGLASSNIELMANAEGLGVLYSGFIQMAINANPAACEYLKIQPEQIKSCMLIGYPNVSFRRTVPRKPTSIQWM